MLMSPPVLCIPVLGEPFVVRMDMSNIHIGAVLEQLDQPVVFFFVQVVSHGVQLSGD